MQRIVAMLVAGVVATTSAAVGGNACPMVQRVAGCCCPHTPRSDATVTCCGGTQVGSMTASARDRQDDGGQVLGAPVLVPLYAVPRSDVGSVVAVARGALLLSGAGPPLLRLRV